MAYLITYPCSYLQNIFVRFPFALSVRNFGHFFFVKVLKILRKSVERERSENSVERERSENKCRYHSLCKAPPKLCFCCKSSEFIISFVL